jgi:hypothetical protein
MCYGRKYRRFEEAGESRRDERTWDLFLREQDPEPPPTTVAEGEDEGEREETREKVPVGAG